MKKLIVLAIFITMQSCAHNDTPVFQEKTKSAEDFVTHSCEHIEGYLYECKEILGN